MSASCEFCAASATWRLFLHKQPDYERFCCGRHLSWTRRLIVLDHRVGVLFSWEAIKPAYATEMS